MAMTQTEPPQPPAKKTRKTQPSLAEIEKAAIHAGFTTISARRFKAQGEFGVLMERMGVVPLGRSKLAFAQHHLEKTIEYLDAMADETDDFDQRHTCKRTIGDLLKQHILAGKELIRSAGRVVSESGEARQSHPSFPPGMAVQVNVNQKKDPP